MNKDVAIDLNISSETQVKDKPYKIFLKIFGLSILFLLMIVSYIFSISPSLYPSSFGKKLDGTFTASSYFGVNPLDLIVIESYENVYDAKEGDIVCFYTSAGHGSGLFQGFDNNIAILQLRDGNVVRISSRLIVGKQAKTIGGIGLFFALYFSYYGAILLTLMTIGFCCYLTFSRINYENTKEGKALLKRYREEKSEIKKRNIAFKKLKEFGDIDFMVGLVLEGDYLENKQKFEELEQTLKVDAKERYKYILTNIHDTYIDKDSLSKSEREKITSLFELMCDSKNLDADEEYMLMDLLLKTKLEDFEIDGFVASSKEFLEGELEMQAYLTFISIIYLMLFKNEKLRDKKFVPVINQFASKVDEKEDENKNLALKYAKNTLKLIKS